jgi:tetratricopeptide (TPR) repeat protein
VEEDTAMTDNPRLSKLKEMAVRFPDDPRARYFLAHELFRIEDWEAAATEYEAYIALSPGDEGAALKSLGLCHERLGRPDAAAEAYRRGIERALAHGHQGLASEIQFLLEELSR